MHFHILGGIGVISGGISVVFDVVVGGSFILWVPDFSIVVTFGRPHFDILLGVPFFSYNFS
jgi:hypothetical protein